MGIHTLSAQAGTSSQRGKTISIDGVSQTKTFTSDGGNAEISGVGNAVNIKGTVNKLEVSGSGNKIYTEKISYISVDGTDNKVYYKTAPTKSGKPATSINGVGNSIQKKE